MANLDVKEAVKMAKSYIVDLLDEENLAFVGLEEVEFDDEKNDWAITVGFCRRWDLPANSMAAYIDQGKHRVYKIVHINDTKREITSVKNREFN